MKERQAEEATIFISGSFDDMRTTDIRFFQEAAKRGKLHVFLFDDEAARIADAKEVKFPLAERLYFLENIRFVSRVSVITSPDSLNALLIEHASANKEAIWAEREREANEQNAVFCSNHGITHLPIPDADLEGFPADPIRNGRTNKKVMVSGCFDWVHSGHVRFFEEASQFGNLFVVVGHDENLRLLKGSGHPLFPEDERQYWVQSIRFVHQTLISSGKGWLDAEPEMRAIKPDYFIVNHDGDKPEKKDLCKQLGIEYKVLTRSPKPGLAARMSTNLRGF